MQTSIVFTGSNLICLNIKIVSVLLSGSRVAQAFSNPREFLNTQEQFQVDFNVLMINIYFLVVLLYQLIADNLSR